MNYIIMHTNCINKYLANNNKKLNIIRMFVFFNCNSNIYD